MRWNPYLNAFGAAAYIVAIVLVMNWIQSLRQNTPDVPPLDGAAVLSLVVLSAAVMAFLFFYRPTVLLLDNKRSEAISYFLTTLATFAALTLLAVLAVALQ